MNCDTVYKCISIGPSLVDMIFCLDPQTYNNVLKSLKAEPGDWISIEEINTLKQLFQLLTNRKFPETNQELVDLNNKGIIKLSAGSTNLGVLSAFPKSIRNEVAVISSIGYINGVCDPISIFFSHSVESLLLNHISYPIEGNNPLGIVLTSSNNPEKILISYSGIANELDAIVDVISEILYVECYELQKGKLSVLLDKLIKSGKYKVALGLGNVKILNDDLLCKIKQYISNGNIYCLTGNDIEFKKIVSITDFSKIRECSFFDKVKYILVTYGENGLTGVFDKKVIFRAAVKPEKIVSTSGAGDISAGVFISGIIMNDDENKILDDAVYLAAGMLESEGSILLAERP